MELEQLYVTITQRGLDDVMSQVRSLQGETTALEKASETALSGFSPDKLTPLQNAFQDLKKTFAGGIAINPLSFAGSVQIPNALAPVQTPGKASSKPQETLSPLQKGLAGLKAKAQELGAAGKKALESFGEEKKLSPLQKGLEKVKAKLEEIGTVGKRVFAGIASVALGGIALGSPRDFEEFSAAIKLFAAQVGILFLPLVRQITRSLRDLNIWFFNLTTEQKENIAWWLKFAAGVGLALFVLPKMITVVGGLVTAFQTLYPVLTTVFTALMGFTGLSAGPLAGVLALAAGIAYLAYNLLNLDGKLKDMQARMQEPDKFMSRQDLTGDPFYKRLKAMKEAGASEKELQAEVTREREGQSRNERAALEANQSLPNQIGSALRKIGSSDFSASQENEDMAKEAADKGEKARLAGEEIIRGKRFEGQKKDNPFQNRPAQQAPQFVAIAEMARRVQSSINTTDPALEIQRMQAQRLKDANDILKDIRTILKDDKGSMFAGTGGDFG